MQNPNEIPEPPRPKTPEEAREQHGMQVRFDFADRYIQQLGHHKHTLLGLPNGAVSHWIWAERVDQTSILLWHRGQERVIQWQGLLCSRQGQGDVRFKSGDPELLSQLMDEIQRRFR